jgi:hypothetical protein
MPGRMFTTGYQRKVMVQTNRALPRRIRPQNTTGLHVGLTRSATKRGRIMMRPTKNPTNMSALCHSAIMCPFLVM